MSGCATIGTDGSVRFHKVDPNAEYLDLKGVVLEIKNLDCVYDMFMNYVRENLHIQNKDTNKLTNIFSREKYLYRKNSTKYDYYFKYNRYLSECPTDKYIYKMINKPWSNESYSVELSDKTYEIIMERLILLKIQIYEGNNDLHLPAINIKNRTFSDGTRFGISSEYLESLGLPLNMKYMDLFVWYRLQDFDEYVSNLEIDNFSEIRVLCGKANISVFGYLNTDLDNMCTIISEVYKNNKDIEECQEIVAKLLEFKQPTP
jgi:hypothetical protein